MTAASSIVGAVPPSERGDPPGVVRACAGTPAYVARASSSSSCIRALSSAVTATGVGSPAPA